MPRKKSEPCRWCSEVNGQHSNACPASARYQEVQKQCGVPMPKMTWEEIVKFFSE